MALQVIVTGGSGFLGSAIIRMLQAKHPDWNIYNLDLRPDTDHKHNEKYYISCDITNTDNVNAAFLKIKPTIVIHTAGTVPKGQSRYSRDPLLRSQTFHTNVHGTSTILSAARLHGVAHFIYTSSCTVLTDDLDHDYHLMTETLPLGRATLTYGASKTAAETLVLAANTPQMTTCALRPSTIIGPGDSYGVIAAIHGCMARRETPYVIGSGDNLYDVVFVDNVAWAHLLAVENLLTEGSAAGQAFFVSNDEPLYFRDFMCAVWAQWGHRARYEVRIPARLAVVVGWVAEWVGWATGRESALSRGSVKDAIGTRYADCGKAKRVLGYKPIVPFADGLRLACEDYKKVLERKSRIESGT